MPLETSYTSLRQQLASVLDQVVNDQEIVIVRRSRSRSRSRDVALVPAKELSSLMETAHLLRSPKNARRLLTALGRATRRRGRRERVAKLREELGLGPAA